MRIPGYADEAAMNASIVGWAHTPFGRLEGETVERGSAPPDLDGLRGLSRRLYRHGAPVRAAIESMNGARFVHDQLELAGWSYP